MPGEGETTSLLIAAHDFEESYEWLDAIHQYEKVADLVKHTDKTIRGDIEEKIGYAAYRAAKQAKTVEEFRQRMRKAVAKYQLAQKIFNEDRGLDCDGKSLRCGAMTAFLLSWLSTDRDQRKTYLRRSRELKTDALERFDKANDGGEYWTTYSHLAHSTHLNYAFEETRVTREKISHEALDQAKKVVAYLSRNNDARELAKAYAILIHCLFAESRFVDSRESEQTYNRIVDYWTQAVENSEENALVETASLGGLERLADFRWLGTEKALSTWKIGLEYCKKTGDRVAMASALGFLAEQDHNKLGSTENPEDGKEIVLGLMNYAQEIQRLHATICYVSPIGVPVWPEAPEAYLSMVLARWCTSDPGEKQEMAEKGLKACPEYLEKAIRIAGPDMIFQAHHVYGLLQSLMAEVADDQETKKRFLADALSHETECMRLAEELSISEDWGKGICKYVLSNINSELAKLASDQSERKRFLLDAAKLKEDCVKLCATSGEAIEADRPVAILTAVAGYQYEYGTLLEKVFALTHDWQHLVKAAEAYAGASEKFQKLDVTTRNAECQWKLGLIHCSLADYPQACDVFLQAASTFRLAADKVPRLRGLYEDHVQYMSTWSEISRARYNHQREEYGQASRHYENASHLVGKTKAWNYLEPNYAAWAKLEKGEEFSRATQTQQAARAFQEAALIFNSARAKLQGQLGRVEDPEENSMISNLVKAAVLRSNYCDARVVLEEARTYDWKGEHLHASQEYGKAASKFEEVSRMSESPEERNNIRSIISLARAWQTENRAAAEASPELHAEASCLFEQAKQLSTTERSKMLALGHSRFCSALEAGTRFLDSRNRADYALAQERLETAGYYYLKSGLPSVSEHTRATKLLFEAYMLMVDAAESTQQEKAKAYTLAEKILETSAALFEASGHSGRKEEVEQLQNKAKDEKEIADAILERLLSPPDASSTLAVGVPRQALEEAVGLERFEKADIRAELNLTRKTLRVGERVELGIELVNAGKGLAQVVKVDNALPAGFDVLVVPEKCEFKDTSLEVQSKRIGPLRADKITIVAQPKLPGVYVVNPRVRYLDESGEYKSFRLEPVELLVQEPHLPEWLRGPSTIRIPDEFRFETEDAREVFRNVAAAFREDYATKGLFIDRAGWRSLMQLAHVSKLPRSAFYGRNGRKGPILEELERLGVLETRVFSHERGRGGEITKVRLDYEKVLLRASGGI